MYVYKVYTVIVNCSLTMITNCNEVINLNYVATDVGLTLSKQIFVVLAYGVDAYDHAMCMVKVHNI